ncbi:hypothetical protein ACET3X_006358 [Alternaria dauci]|uniref:Uncharacterized protein n=1 Tax=Alternaria dauci TaxID=48095 RepID=A0ABR3UIF7_9PLEO
MPSLTNILALGALASLAVADNIYTYTKPGCKGAAFFFKDIDHNVCALTITGNATSTADAIARGLTTVRSGKLEVQETGKKHFIAWDEGPGSNADGPLQCGTIAQNVPVKKRETCLSGSIHGFSWTEPGADGSDSGDSDDDDSDDNNDNDKVKRQANDDPIWRCNGSKDPSAVHIDGKYYNLASVPEADREALMECAWTDLVPGAEFDKYVFVPDF